MKKHTQQPKENQQVFPVVELSSETSPEFTELSDSESVVVSGGAGSNQTHTQQPQFSARSASVAVQF